MRKEVADGRGRRTASRSPFSSGDRRPRLLAGRAAAAPPAPDPATKAAGSKRVAWRAGEDLQQCARVERRLAGAGACPWRPGLGVRRMVDLDHAVRGEGHVHLGP